MLYGDEFDVPSQHLLARCREESDRKLFEASEIQLMLEALLGHEVAIGAGKAEKKVQRTADLPLRAAILLGINTGCGNADLSYLQRRHLDLKTKWLDFPRNKTGAKRRVPLWDETVAALEAAIEVRPRAKEKADDGCVFLTDSGTRLVRVGETTRTDYVGREFHKLMRLLKINGRRGLGLYSLRHTFASIALQTGDRDTIRALMGHVERDVLGAFYDEIGPAAERRLVVVNHVRSWLFGDAAAKGAK